MTLALLGVCALISVLALLRVRGNRRAIPVAVMCVLVCLLLSFFEGRLAVREHRWSAATSKLLGVEVKVHCQRMLAYAFDTSSILGFVPRDPKTGKPAKETWLRRDTCNDLADLDPARPTDAQVHAVHVLTHEAMHMAGEPNEARTECFAVQRNAAMAVLLGSTPDQAKAMSVRYFDAIHHRLPREYHSRECREGGEWDEGLVTSPWNIAKAAESER